MLATHPRLRHKKLNGKQLGLPKQSPIHNVDSSKYNDAVQLHATAGAKTGHIAPGQDAAAPPSRRDASAKVTTARRVGLGRAAYAAARRLRATKPMLSPLSVNRVSSESGPFARFRYQGVGFW